MREPLDTDLHMPVVVDREQAAQRLLSLLPADLADEVWDELIAPLYDARQMSIRWQRGQCRSCGVPHPESQFAKTKRRVGHSMHCPLYVGPLEHRVVRGHQALMGWHNDCSCDAWAVPPVQCPDAGVDWRGPRPDGSCSVAAEETVPDNRAPAVAEHLMAGRRLTAADPEPPKGTVVVDDCGVTWENDGYRPCCWIRPEATQHDPETWRKIAGNYGPVTVVEWGAS